MAFYLAVERPKNSLMVRRGSGVRVPASACLRNRTTERFALHLGNVQSVQAVQQSYGATSVAPGM